MSSIVSGSEFKKRSDFSNTDDYALYVRQKLEAGMMIRCCRTYEEVHQGDIGKVTKVKKKNHDEPLVLASFWIMVDVE